MQGQTGTYAKAGTSSQAQQAELAFKRYILMELSMFAHTPAEDLYRINLLGQMMNRYDELLGKGLSHDNAVRQTETAFRNMAELMRQDGFEPGTAQQDSHWPQLSEDDIAEYIKESNVSLHRRAMGTALCSACAAPLMVLLAIGEWLYFFSDALVMLGLVGMFAMVGMGVYCLTSAKKPKKQEQIKNGRFSLSARLRKKLSELRELTENKARKRKGKGIAMLATCPVPVLVGAMLSEMWGHSDCWPILGVAGLLLMVGAGVYEVVMAKGEKNVMHRLLKEKVEED